MELRKNWVGPGQAITIRVLMITFLTASRFHRGERLVIETNCHTRVFGRFSVSTTPTTSSDGGLRVRA